jgi:HK97 family phage major capsid protein
MENFENLKAQLRDLKNEQRAILADQRKMLDKAEAEDRDLTDHEEGKYEILEKRYDDIEKRAEDLKYKIERKESGYVPAIFYEIPEATEEEIRSVNNKMETAKIQNKEVYFFNVNKKTSERTLRDSYNAYLRDGAHALTAEEYRALQMDLDTAGGFLVAPKEVAREVLRGLDNEVFIRQLSRTYTVDKAMSLGVPSLDNDFGDPTWTGELGTGSEDDDMDFGSRDLFPHPLARRIKVSNKLLRAAIANPESLVTERMRYKLGVVMENCFLNGTGVDQPLGVFTASASGIDTDRDVSTGMTSTNVTADGLVNAVGALKSQYRKNAWWIMSRDCENRISKLKTGKGDYMWRMGLEAGRPNLLLGYPVYVSEYCPNTFTSGKYVAVLGDFKYYFICDSLQVQVQRLVELYAETNQTGFICRVESDGMPCLSEAFVRVKLS